jgi:hypothetical protein
MERAYPEEIIKFELPKIPITTQNNTQSEKIIYVIGNQNYDQTFRLAVILAIIAVVGIVAIVATVRK